MSRDQLCGPIKVDLRARRLNAGHSLRSLSREIGLNPETIKSAEAGDPVYPRTAFKIAQFHGLEIREVWNLDELEAAA